LERLERLARDKCSSLFIYNVSDKEKKGFMILKLNVSVKNCSFSSLMMRQYEPEHLSWQAFPALSNVCG